MEAATLAFLSGGERYGRDNEIDIPWTDDLESRRNAALAMCITIITQFVSSDAREQVLTVAALEAGFRPRLFDSECQTQGFGLAHWRFL
jgi:hypothetical protein